MLFPPLGGDHGSGHGHHGTLAFPRAAHADGGVGVRKTSSTRILIPYNGKVFRRASL